MRFEDRHPEFFYRGQVDIRRRRETLVKHLIQEHGAAGAVIGLTYEALNGSHERRHSALTETPEREG